MPQTYSPLRYPGGKTKFYGYVRNILECNDLLGETYIEPFAGGAGLALKLLLNNDVKRIVINDFDPAIYCFWNSVLLEPNAFCDFIMNVPLTREEWIKQKHVYLEQDISKPLLLGFATFFLNRTNVSGIVNGGMIGGKNQNGSYKLDARFNRIALAKKIMQISERKDQITVLNFDAKKLLQSQELRHFYKSFLNLDPPYVKKGHQLYKNAFTEKDHVELFKMVSACKRKWIVTYDICPLVADLYGEYRSSYLDVTYSVHSSQRAKEYIFFSNNLVLPESIVLRNTDSIR